MGLFKKNKNVNNDKVSEQEVSVPVGKKAQKETMASVLRESVVSAVLENFRANTNCITQTAEGELVYAGLYLDVADIGGLSKKSKKDEAKGQIIESINNNRIKAMITAEMLNDGNIIIIPDVMTLDAMDEFTLLREAPYKIALVNDDGDIKITDYDVTFDAMTRMVEEGTHIDSVLEDIGVEFSDDDDYDEYTDEDEEDDVLSSFGSQSEPVSQPESVPEYEDDDIPFDDEDEDDEDYSDYGGGNTSFEDVNEVPDEDDEETSFDEEDIPADVPEIASVDDETDDTYDEPEEEEITEEMLNETIVRRFYSDDLGLEVSTEPFDAQFKAMSSFVAFDENRGEGWLNHFLNERAANANAQLRRLHNNNIAKARNAFIQLVAKACEDIQAELDCNNPDTRYNAILASVIDKKEKMHADANEDIKAKRAELDKDYEARLQKAQDDAAAMARQQFITRFGKQHDNDISAIETSVHNNIEEQYQQAKRDINDKRRNEAQARLDCAITATLKLVSAQYSKYLDEEQAMYERFAKENMEFLSTHLQDDIARTKALEDELNRSNVVASTINECKGKIEAASAEFDAKRSALETEIERIKRETEAAISKKEAECQERIQAAREDVQAKQAVIDKLAEEYATCSETKGREYESRINELKNEVAAERDHCKSIESTHKKLSAIFVALSAVAVIAAVAIGVLVGLNMNVNKNVSDLSQKNQTAYVQEQTESDTTQPQLDVTPQK